MGKANGLLREKQGKSSQKVLFQLHDLPGLRKGVREELRSFVRGNIGGHMAFDWKEFLRPSWSKLLISIVLAFALLPFID